MRQGWGGGEVRVSPLGPGIVPLCCPCVVVDKVDSAIVLALLCGNKQEMNRKKKVFMEFHVYSQPMKKQNNNNKTQMIIIIKIKKNPKKSGTILSQHAGGQRGSLSLGGKMSHPGGRKQEGLCDISLRFVRDLACVCAGIH